MLYEESHDKTLLKPHVNNKGTDQPVHQLSLIDHCLCYSLTR